MSIRQPCLHNSVSVKQRAFLSMCITIFIHFSLFLRIHHDIRYNLTTHCSSSSRFDGDQFLLFYRRDLQEKDGWDVPKTWDELVDVAGTSCAI